MLFTWSVHIGHVQIYGNCFTLKFCAPPAQHVSECDNVSEDGLYFLRMLKLSSKLICGESYLVKRLAIYAEKTVLEQKQYPPRLPAAKSIYL